MASVEASGRRILVTGAGGFVGRWLMADLRAQVDTGDRLVPTYRDAGDAAGDAGGVTLDLRDKAAIDALVRELRPTAVVHLAAMSAVGAVQRDPDMAWDINVKATQHLAQSVLTHAPVARFVHVSSGEIYGGLAQQGGAVTEAEPLAPRNLYAVTKAAADLLIGQMTGAGLNGVRFRAFNHTGPGQSTDFVVPSFAAQIARIERGASAPVIEVGNLEAQRDFCDVRDVVRAYAHCALGQGPVGAGVVNLASGQGRSIRSVLDDLLALARIPIELRTDPGRVRPDHSARIEVDIALARQVLGWTPQIPWSTTLADVLAAWRQAAGAV